MAINFPNLPTVNQIFNPTQGVAYQWDGVKWRLMATGNTAIWEPIAVLDVNAVTQSIVTGLAAYRDLRLRWDLIGTVTGINQLGLQYSPDNGSTFISGATDYALMQHYAIQLPTASSGAGALSLAYQHICSSITNQGVGASGVVYISRLNKAATKNVNGTNYYVNATQGHSVDHFGGGCSVGYVCNAIKILIQSGTMTGRIIIEGVRG